MVCGGPKRIALVVGTSRNWNPRRCCDLLRRLHRLPRGDSETSVPNFVMALMRRNRQ
jgi:hypothetical protein